MSRKVLKNHLLVLRFATKVRPFCDYLCRDMKTFVIARETVMWQSRDM